jgi:hypothetical protein
MTCIDYDKKVCSGYPFELYHATTNKQSVCKGGLRPSFEIGAVGLGGKPNKEDPTISFTVDRLIATEIAKDLKTFVNIMNGTYTPENIAKKLDESDEKEYLRIGDGKPFVSEDGAYYYTELPILPSKLWKLSVENPDAEFIHEKKVKKIEREDPLASTEPKYYETDEVAYEYDKLKKGLVKIQPRIYNQEKLIGKTLTEIRKIDPKAEPCYFNRNPKPDEELNCVMRTGTEHEKRKTLYDFWRKYYLPLRDTYGGMHDPKFMMRNETLKKVSGLDGDGVGIFKVDAYLPEKCVVYTRGGKQVCSSNTLVENDFDLSEHEGIRKGEDINKEIRISRERFTSLEEIPIEPPKLKKIEL